MVRKAINYFAKELKSEEKEKIQDCIKLIKFGMGNTLLTFRDKYYEYGGGKEIEEREA